jgi:hypothetical protein
MPAQIIRQLGDCDVWLLAQSRKKANLSGQELNEWYNRPSMKQG